jgi:predicted nucleotidyltransferase component of viral defense system
MNSLKNIPASVRQRLLNRARNDRRPFNELLQYYAIERFLYRLSQSAHADKFILKGALMLRVWRSPELRPTMDIDLLGRSVTEEYRLVEQIRDILAVDVEDDGLVFNADSINTERITEDADYEGTRILFFGKLDTAKIHMQIDIGFGDVVYPEIGEADLPTLLDFPVPRMLCYSRESLLAEKFEVMVKRGGLNSRMKDFYDIWMLSRQFDFVGTTLAEAIRLTFEQRGTTIPMEIEIADESFIKLKQIQWSAFRKKLKLEYVPKAFGEIAIVIYRFLNPIISSISSQQASPKNWNAPGPWI